jgi:hypothetical protein
MNTKVKITAACRQDNLSVSFIEQTGDTAKQRVNLPQPEGEPKHNSSSSLPVRMPQPRMLWK